MPSPYPHIGSLNQSITIEKNTPVKSTASGQYEDSWATFKTTMAKVDYKSGTEKEQENAVISTQFIAFTIRFFTGINVKMRILYNSNYYNIRSISIIGRYRYLILTAERVK